MPTEMPRPSRAEASTATPKLAPSSSLSLAFAAPTASRASPAIAARSTAFIEFLPCDVGLDRGGRRLIRFKLEMELVVLHRDVHVTAVRELAKQQLFGQRALHALLDHPRHRARAHLLVVAVLAEPV